MNDQAGENENIDHVVHAELFSDLEHALTSANHVDERAVASQMHEYSERDDFDPVLNLVVALRSVRRNGFRLRYAVNPQNGNLSFSEELTAHNGADLATQNQDISEMHEETVREHDAADSAYVLDQCLNQFCRFRLPNLSRSLNGFSYALARAISKNPALLRSQIEQHLHIDPDSTVDLHEKVLEFVASFLESTITLVISNASAEAGVQVYHPASPEQGHIYLCYNYSNNRYYATVEDLADAHIPAAAVKNILGESVEYNCSGRRNSSHYYLLVYPDNILKSDVRARMKISFTTFDNLVEEKREGGSVVYQLILDCRYQGVFRKDAFFVQGAVPAIYKLTPKMANHKKGIKGDKKKRRNQENTFPFENDSATRKASFPLLSSTVINPPPPTMPRSPSHDRDDAAMPSPENDSTTPNRKRLDSFSTQTSQATISLTLPQPQERPPSPSSSLNSLNGSVEPVSSSNSLNSLKLSPEPASSSNSLSHLSSGQEDSYAFVDLDMDDYGPLSARPLTSLYSE